jgi:hypothetical protein
VVKQNNNRKKGHQKPESSRKSMGIIFWLAFFVLVISLFFINGSLIRRTVENTHFLDRLFNRPQDTAEPLAPELSEPINEAPEPDLTGDRTPPEEIPQNIPLPPPVQDPAAPVTTPAEAPPESSPVLIPDPSPRVEHRERALYFMQVDNDGMVLRMRVSRSIAVSDSPMTDALLVLLEGPSPDETRRGLVSFIPPGTKLLSVMVRGTTAYINLNQDFLFSTFGVEGYAAQLRQVVWTATEFSTVKDVQILIEGKRVDYLGESILIGSPITRDMLP